MTVLDRLLAELGRSRGPIRSTELAHRLGVSPSALDGMLGTLSARGRIVDSGGQQGPSAMACSGGACGTTCVGIEACPFIVTAPRTHHLTIAGPPRT